MPYTSIFDGSYRVTRRDFCAILNLDVSRPNLEFEDAEIHKAFRKRSIQFHPDGQWKHKGLDLSKATREVLFNDATRARDHLLQGIESVPGKAHTAASDPDDLNAVFKELFVTNASVLRGFILGKLATFSGNQINLAYIHQLAPLLSALEPCLGHFRVNTVAELMRQTKRQLEDNTLTQDSVSILIKRYMPDAPPQTNAQIESIHGALLDVSPVLIKLLTKAFISDLELFLECRPELGLLPDFTMWRDIIDLTVLAFLSATSIPRYVSALLEIMRLSYQHNSLRTFVLFSPGIIVLGSLLFPVAVVASLVAIAVNSAYRLLADSFSLIRAVLSLPFQISHAAAWVKLVTALVNVIVLWPANLLADTINGVLNVFSGYNPVPNMRIPARDETPLPRSSPNAASFFQADASPGNDVDTFLQYVLRAEAAADDETLEHFVSPA